jgi:hypothetical protein
MVDLTLSDKKPACATRVVAFAAVLCSTALVPALATPAVTEADIAADSKLEMLETAVSGSYQSYSIHIATREGETTLTANKDGVETVVEVPLQETLTLWRTLLDAGLEELGDATSETPSPDGSEFTVRFHAGNVSGGFVASGVDSLSDTRYREIIREILKLANTRAAGAGRE